MEFKTLEFDSMDENCDIANIVVKLINEKKFDQPEATYFASKLDESDNSYDLFNEAMQELMCALNQVDLE